MSSALSMMAYAFEHSLVRGTNRSVDQVRYAYVGGEHYRLTTWKVKGHPIAVSVYIMSINTKWILLREPRGKVISRKMFISRMNYLLRRYPFGALALDHGQLRFYPPPSIEEDVLDRSEPWIGSKLFRLGSGRLGSGRGRRSEGLPSINERIKQINDQYDECHW